MSRRSVVLINIRCPLFNTTGQKLDVHFCLTRLEEYCDTVEWERSRNKEIYEAIELIARASDCKKRSSARSSLTTTNSTAGFVCLALTITVSTASVERTFSALKRIKIDARNYTGQAGLSASASMAIEKKLLHGTETHGQSVRRSNWTFLEERQEDAFCGEINRIFGEYIIVYS